MPLLLLLFSYSIILCSHIPDYFWLINNHIQNKRKICQGYAFFLPKTFRIVLGRIWDFSNPWLLQSNYDNWDILNLGFSPCEGFIYYSQLSLSYSASFGTSIWKYMVFTKNHLCGKKYLNSNYVSLDTTYPFSPSTTSFSNLPMFPGVSHQEFGLIYVWFLLSRALGP